MCHPIGLAAALVAFIAVPAARAQASFQGLGDLPGGAFQSRASGVSSSGAIAGESAEANGLQAFLWTPEAGMQLVGDLPGGPTFSLGRAVSANAVVVGTSEGPNGEEAFRWTAAGGMQGLGVIAPNPTIFESGAHGVSTDGVVVVGYSSNGNQDREAFRWTAAGGMQGLGDLPGGIFRSAAHAVSADGAVVVGDGIGADDGTQAFRWTAAGGMVGLGDLPGGGKPSSHAYAVSADGEVVVGRGATETAGSEAFRWSSAQGMVGLGDLPGGDLSSRALGVSGDGAIVVGSSSGQAGAAAFIWTADEGMRDLKAVLENDYGLNLTGWALHEARAISPDGTIIVGIGSNPSGQLEAWRAVLPSQCEEPLALRSWLNPAGGAFGDPNNWSTSAVPSGADRALFALADGADYTVTFAAGHANDQVMLRGGNHVRFALGGQAYEVDASSGCGPSLDIADAFGSPRLEVENGSVVAAGGARVDGPAGTELIARAGGTFLLGGALGVGMEAGRSGHIRVESGGEFNLTSEGVATIGGAGAGSITVEGGGDTEFFGTVRIGDASGGSGELLATGSGADLALFGSTVVGASGVGRLVGSDAAVIDAREILLGRFAGGDGMLIVETGAQVSARDIDVGIDGLGRVRVRTLGGLIVSGGVTIPRGPGPGSVRVTSAGGMSAGVIRLRAGGSLTVGGLVATGQLIHDESGQLNLSGGCLTIQGGPCQTNRTGAGGTVEADTVWIGPGAVFDSTTVQLGPGGVLGGAGALPLDLTNAGTINPGDSAGVAGTFTIGGAYTQAADGALEVEVAGATSHDRLAVAGAAGLAGALRFRYVAGHTPAPGDVYEVLTAGSVSGEFSAVEGPPGSTFSVAYAPMSVTATVLTVAAEPPADPVGLVLHPPAPNPAHVSTSIRFDLPAAGRVRLAIYDALGRQLAVLIDGERPAGVQQVALGAATLAPGAYQVLLQTAHGSRVQRLTVVR